MALEHNEKIGLITIRELCRWMNHHHPVRKEWFHDIADAMDWHTGTNFVFSDNNEVIVQISNGYKVLEIQAFIDFEKGVRHIPSNCDTIL